MNNNTLTDVELIAKKQNEITHGKLIQAVLVIIIALLVGTVAMLILFARITPPSPTPEIDVISWELYDGKYGLKVPDTITVGELFSYQARGEKLVSGDPEVRLQTVCMNDGGQVIQTIATFTSVGVPKGKFTVNRKTTVPPSTKNVASDNCELQSVSTFTFYTVDSTGNEQSFEISEVAQSNKFKLVVPEEEKETVSVITPTTPQVTQPITSPQVAAPTPQEAQDPVPQPEQVQPDPQPYIVGRVPLLNSILCRVL